MIKVHHLNNSRSQRILWLLEELKLDYEIVHYKRDATTRLAPPELKAVHPLGATLQFPINSLQQPTTIGKPDRYGGDTRK